MGRGIAYRYKHFMLVDDNPNCVTEGEPSYLNQDFFWQDLLDTTVSLASAARGESMTANDRFEVYTRDGTSQSTRDCLGIAQNLRWVLILDTSGGAPALALIPKRYSKGAKDYFYKVDAEAAQLFNKLIKAFSARTFRTPTSAWTSKPLTTYAA